MLSKLVVPSLLLMASVNNVLAAPLERTGSQAKRDDLDDLLGGLESVVVDALTALPTDVSVPLASIIGDFTGGDSADVTDALSLPTDTSDPLNAFPTATDSSNSLSTSLALPTATDSADSSDATLAMPMATDSSDSSDATLAPPTATDSSDSSDATLAPPMATDSFDLGGVNGTAALPTATDSFDLGGVNGTAAIPTSTDASGSLDVTGAISTVDAVPTGVITLPGGGLWTPPALTVGGDATATAAPTEAATGGSKRDSGFGAEVASFASEVIGILPSALAAPATSLLDKFAGTPTPAPTATSLSGNKLDTVPSASSVAPATSSTNAALGDHLSTAQVSFTGVALMIGSMILGSMVAL